MGVGVGWYIVGEVEGGLVGFEVVDYVVGCVI